MDSAFTSLAASLGASVDQIKVITCLLLSYPLASIYTHIHVPTIRHLFSIAVSLFYLLLVFQLYSGTAQLFFSIISTYFICSTSNGSRMPWTVFMVVMGHLTINHLYRAFYDISLSTFEITGPQMVLTMKLTTFAWNIYDGRQPIEKLDKWQKEKRVVRMPTLLEFLGYAFYFPGMLVGPYLIYSDYDALVHETVFLQSPSTPGAPVSHAMPAGRKRTAYYKMLRGLIFLGFYVVFGPSLNFSVLLQDAWMARTLLVRFIFVQLIGFSERSKYYAIWSLTEGAAIVTGLGFTGYDASGRSKWDGASNVDILRIERPDSFKGLIDAWNIKTNIWLRECVYKRVTPTGKKPGFMSSMFTFFTSAFWHGIAGGYIRSTVRPLFLPPLAALNRKASSAEAGPPSSLKRMYDILGTLTTIYVVNYAVIPFILLDVGPSLEGWRRTFWYGHIMVGGALIFFWLGGTKWLTGVQQRRLQVIGGESVPTQMSNGTTTPSTPGPHIVAPLDKAMM